MSVEDARSIAKTLCDNFRDKVFSGDNTAKLSISFFGGEPPNLMLLKQSLSTVMNKNSSFNMVSQRTVFISLMI